MSRYISKKGHAPDYTLLVLITLLTVIGLVILASASSELGKRRFDDSYYYLKHQLASGLVVGMVGFALASRINYHRYKKLALVFLIVSVVFLALVFTSFGVARGGAHRWVAIGPIGFQPSELLKLTFLIYVAAWLSNTQMKRTKDFFRGIVPFVVVSGIVAGFLLAQPATSTVVILLTTALIMYFVSGVKWRYIGLLILIGVIGLAAVTYLTPYRLERITTFLNPESDQGATGYQITQALNAIGSGGITGVGYGRSASRVMHLPAQIDDSIFAVAAEELGFVGASLLVAFFGILVVRFFWLALRMRDQFGRLILIGFGSIIGLQAFVNMAAISGLIPLTGVPLPFISFGGTALAVFLTMSGVAFNISRYTR